MLLRGWRALSHEAMSGHKSDGGHAGNTKPAGGTTGTIDAETLARCFHEAYERLAPRFGYETRPETVVSWDEVPEQNWQLMIAVCDELLRGVLARRMAADPSSKDDGAPHSEHSDS